MINRIVKYGFLFMSLLLIAAILFTGCTSTGSGSPDRKTAATANATEAGTPSESAAKTSESEGKDPSGTVPETVDDVPAPAERIDALPEYEERVKAETNGSAYIGFFKMNGLTVIADSGVYYRIDKLPVLDSRTYAASAETRFDDGVRLGVVEPRGIASLALQEFFVSDRGVFDVFKNKILSLDYAGTPQNVEGTYSEYFVIDGAEKRTYYAVSIDGSVFKYADGQYLPATKKLSAEDAAYFYALSMNYVSFFSGTATANYYTAGLTDHARVFVSKDGKKTLLSEEQTKELMTLLCGENPDQYEMYTTRGIDEFSDKTELFRFYLVYGEGELAEPQADENVWYRFYSDGTVCKVLESGCWKHDVGTADICCFNAYIVWVNVRTCPTEGIEALISA